MRPKWTARALRVGRVPGWPRQTGHVRVFGGSPKESSQPQNIFVRVWSCTWISIPMTGCHSVKERPSRIEPDSLLERVGGVEQAVLRERRPGDLEADRQLFGKPGGYRDGGNAGERHRHSA